MAPSIGIPDRVQIVIFPVLLLCVVVAVAASNGMPTRAGAIMGTLFALAAIGVCASIFGLFCLASFAAIQFTRPPLATKRDLGEMQGEVATLRKLMEEMNERIKRDA